MHNELQAVMNNRPSAIYLAEGERLQCCRWKTLPQFLLPICHILHAAKKLHLTALTTVWWRY